MNPQHNSRSAKTATLVCVTDQESCATHIRAGRVLADLTGTDLVVVHVSPAPSTEDAQTLEYLYSVARQNGAAMQVLYAEQPTKALIRFIKRSKVSNLITGQPESSDSLPSALWRKFTHITFFTVDDLGNLSAIFAPRRQARSLPRQTAAR